MITRCQNSHKSNTKCFQSHRKTSSVKRLRNFPKLVLLSAAFSSTHGPKTLSGAFQKQISHKYSYVSILHSMINSSLLQSESSFCLAQSHCKHHLPPSHPVLLVIRYTVTIPNPCEQVTHSLLNSGLKVKQQLQQYVKEMPKRVSFK